MTMLAAGSVAAISGCATEPTTSPQLVGVSSSVAASKQLAPTTAVPTPVALTSTPGPPVKRPAGTLTRLDGVPGHPIALTIDDGTSSEVVGAYVKFAKDTGARFTFFVTACNDSWRDHAAELKPLVESGQIQLGNHTWDHPDLTGLSEIAVAEQLSKTKTFLRNTYGVDGTPYYRPPYGFHNEVVDKVAADHGYSTPALWYGSLSDSGVITEKYLVHCARQYFHSNSIIIGHANHPAVTHVYGQLAEIIRERKLSMVTLNDVYVK
ncbi:polysaccharide deacetylase family protein [Gordonia sp. TBRC 11910]|uniref:Polysaccharide deacetylase family protein n=1 Tax=Gordonia asplenii TaxID=2725283 RepID=A0A848KWQ0_9ACTN|nr:polysaccharide deacetylase family protein [Gordonia asplenii]NMO01295.1 polysaccharide deacetylase family protein [Gordonia asplenii]